LGLAGVLFGGIIVDDDDTDDSGGHLFLQKSFGDFAFSS
jgi:hypothetical protein